MANIIVDGVEKRPGRVAVRSSGGMPILDETYEFLVKTDDPFATRLSVITTPGLPLVGITVSPSGYGICKNIDAVRRPNQVEYWDGTATFSSEVDERQSEQDPTKEPTEWVPIYETKMERVQQTVTKDKSGNAIANSAGQPFEVGLTVARYLPVWEFYQFESDSVTDEEIIDRHEKINSGTFKGRAAETLLLNVLTSVVGFYYGKRTRLTNYRLTYDKLKWRHRRLDVGTVYLDSGEHKPYLDADGNVMLGALDGSGGKQTPGTAPAVLEFDVYDQIAFSFLRTS